MNSRQTFLVNYITPPVIILAGGCDISFQDKIGSYRNVLIESFSQFQGTILSGGTSAGIAQIAADIGECYPGRITTIGYLPDNSDADGRYSYLFSSGGHTFSMAEPLQMWRDIILAGCKPGEVKLIGVNGGVISIGEYRLACAMGAQVGLIQGSGGSVDEMLSDPVWREMVISLEPITKVIQMFIYKYPILDDIF